MPKKEFPVFTEKGEVSQEFRNAFCQSGSDRIQCTCCGRVYFCSSDFGGEREELDDLLKQAEESPEDVIDWSDTISWFHYGERQVVFGCKCRYDVALEQTIWAWRHDICEYLVARSKTEKQSADQSLVSARTAATAIKDS